MFPRPARATLCVVLLAALAGGPRAHAATGYAVGDTLPAIVAADQDGSPYALASLRGSWVFIDFCTAWCPLCNVMGAQTQAVYDTFGDGSLVQFEYVTALVQGLSGAASTQSDAQDWASLHGLSRPILHDGGSAAASPLFDFAQAGFTAVPMGLFVDPDGVVRDVTVGYQFPSQIVDRLSELAGLPQPPPPPPPPVMPKCPPLAGATFAVSIGGVPDTSPLTTTTGDQLRYELWGGAFGGAELGVVQSNPLDINEESLMISFGNTDLALLPRNLPITLELGSMSWPDGLPRTGSPANVVAQLSVYVDQGDGNIDIVGTSGLLPLSHPDGHSLRIGPFTLGSIAGMPQNVFALEASAIVRRDYSVATLGVTPRTAATPRLALAAPWPNPARTGAVLGWSATPGRPASVEVLDVTGRRVARPRVLREDANGGRAAWNLQDESCRRVPPGVYLARVTAGAESAICRIVVIR